MNDRIQDTPETDEFDPIELGSVSEETRGVFEQGSELDISNNSRALP